MSAGNLGVCVGPSLLWSDSPATCPTEDLRTVPALVEILIAHCELLCGPHVPNLLGDPRDSGTEESDCKYERDVSRTPVGTRDISSSSPIHPQETKRR